MNAKERKERPVFTGVLKYFPDAIMEIARVSLAGNKQHHPDKPLHWDRSKSTDDYDALARHLIDAGTVKVNSDNINTYQNSAIAIGGSGAFDIRDNLGKQIQGFGT